MAAQTTQTENKATSSRRAKVVRLSIKHSPRKPGVRELFEQIWQWLMSWMWCKPSEAGSKREHPKNEWGKAEWAIAATSLVLYLDRRLLTDKLTQHELRGFQLDAFRLALSMLILSGVWLANGTLILSSVFKGGLLALSVTATSYVGDVTIYRHRLEKPSSKADTWRLGMGLVLATISSGLFTLYAIAPEKIEKKISALELHSNDAKVVEQYRDVQNSRNTALQTAVDAVTKLENERLQTINEQGSRQNEIGKTNSRIDAAREDAHAESVGRRDGQPVPQGKRRKYEIAMAAESDQTAVRAKLEGERKLAAEKIGSLDEQIAKAREKAEAARKQAMMRLEEFPGYEPLARDIPARTNAFIAILSADPIGEIGMITSTLIIFMGVLSVEVGFPMSLRQRKQPAHFMAYRRVALRRVRETIPPVIVAKSR